VWSKSGDPRDVLATAAFEAGVAAVLGELKRTIHNTELNRKDLRKHAEERLLKFAVNAKGVAQVGNVEQHKIEYLFDACNQYLQFALRQFDVGFFDPSEPETPPIANAITIGTMTGSVIQQGSPGATQRAELQLDIKTVTAAVGALESELSKVHLDENATAALAADIATIKAQLSKPSPSIRILQEAGKSIRNVTEGIAGGLLTRRGRIGSLRNSTRTKLTLRATARARRDRVRCVPMISTPSKIPTPRAGRTSRRPRALKRGNRRRVLINRSAAAICALAMSSIRRTIQTRGHSGADPTAKPPLGCAYLLSDRFYTRRRSSARITLWR
jgi:hypothetical protein